MFVGSILRAMELISLKFNQIHEYKKRIWKLISESIKLMARRRWMSLDDSRKEASIMFYWQVRKVRGLNVEFARLTRNTWLLQRMFECKWIQNSVIQPNPYEGIYT